MADADPDRSSRSSTAETAAWNEARYRLLLEGLTDYALIMVSPDGYVLTWNAGAERINGYRADEIVGRHFSCFFPPALVEADAPSEGLRIAAETGHHVSEGWRRRKDGTEIWVTVITRPIRDASGALVGFAKLTHDLTEQKRADSLAAASARRESLLQAERDARMQAQRVVRLKDEFIATLSHELRTPLHAILGWVNILTSGRASADQIAKGLEVIERNARTQSRIIDDLLDEDMLIDNLRLDVRSVDVREVVASTVESIVPTTTAKGLRVEADVSADIGVVNADSARLQQILWNLVTNAVKFTPRGGSIRIAATREVDHVEIRVSDTGQGISSEFMPRIFERHSQEDGAAGSQLGGLGLGLSIAKQLAELHGGTLRGESGGSGHGSTFILTLPVGDDERAVPEHAAMRAAAPRRREIDPVPSGMLTGLRILVVDDEPDARNLLRTLLGDCGADVIAVHSGPEALRLLFDERVDLIICDIGMPGMDGLQFLRRYRDLSGPDRMIPAIALTAFVRPEDRRQALHAGYQAHLGKPFETHELVNLAAKLAARSPDDPGSSPTPLP